MTCLHDRGPRIGKLKLDLSCLRPLWQLYDGLSKEQVDGGSVVSPVIRGLTELFLQVEATAMVRRHNIIGIVCGIVHTLKTKC